MGVLKTVRKSVDAHVPSAPGGVQWEDAPLELTRRVALVEVHGDTGTGRTTWALSAPGPIALIHAAEKIDGIVQPYVRAGKQIRQYNFGASFRGDDEEVAAQASKVWQGLEAAWYDAFNWARSIVLDTHTEAWELIRLAHFGDLKPSSGRVDANWGPVNARWRSLFKRFRNQLTTNVIIIGQTKDEYTKTTKTKMGERTGRTILAGQKEIGVFADVIVRTEKEWDSDKGTTFKSRIEKAWYNAYAEGVELEDENSNFPAVMSLITEVDQSEWEA